MRRERIMLVEVIVCVYVPYTERRGMYIYRIGRGRRNLHRVKEGEKRRRGEREKAHLVVR